MSESQIGVKCESFVMIPKMVEKWLKIKTVSESQIGVKLVSNWCQRVKLVSKWCQMWVICDDTKNGWKMNQDQNCVRVSKRVSNVCQMWWHQKKWLKKWSKIKSVSESHMRTYCTESDNEFWFRDSDNPYVEEIRPYNTFRSEWSLSINMVSSTCKIEHCCGYKRTSCTESDDEFWFSDSDNPQVEEIRAYKLLEVNDH